MNATAADRTAGSSSLIDVLDRVLDTGIVMSIATYLQHSQALAGFEVAPASPTRAARRLGSSAAPA